MGKVRQARKDRGAQAGREGATRPRSRLAAIEARRRELTARRERDRAKLLGRYEGIEPDGRVLCMYGTHAEVSIADGAVRLCLLAPKVHDVFGICAGDLVWTEPGATADERVIAARSPRRTALRVKRSETDRAGHVIAANVDRMAIVASLREPPLRTGALDRYLVLASILGLRPLIVVTKADLQPPFAPLPDALAPYCDLGVPVVVTSGATGQGIEDLLAALRGGISVFAGHSGVGKTRLCQALGLEGVPDVGGLSFAHGRIRGRHTTSVARLLELPGEEGWVVDTPGVRSIGLFDLRRRDAGVHFPEIADVAGDCEFADCLHLGEDGCAVQRAVDDGGIPRARYDGYVRLALSLE